MVFAYFVDYKIKVRVTVIIITHQFVRVEKFLDTFSIEK